MSGWETVGPDLSDEELDRLAVLSDEGSPAPWYAADGVDEIRVGVFPGVAENLTVTYSSIPWGTRTTRGIGVLTDRNGDLIAGARNALVPLVSEIRRHRAASRGSVEHDARMSSELLDDLDDVSLRGDPPPWTSWVEGRDGLAGCSFLIIGRDDDRDEDMYISVSGDGLRVDRDSGPAGFRDLQLIAKSRTALPLLIEEVRRLRSSVRHSTDPS